MTLKEVLDAKGYHYDSIFTGRAIDIDFQTTEELCYALGYILKYVHRIDAEIPERRDDVLQLICPNYPITEAYTSGGYDMKWGAQFRVYFSTLRNMPLQLLCRIQDDPQMRLSGSAFVESLLYIGFNPGDVQDTDLIIAAINEVFDRDSDRDAFYSGFYS